MTEQSVIQMLLLVVLVRHVDVCWCLLARDWSSWQHLREWKKPKRGRRRPKSYKKPKPFEGVTRGPVCAAYAAEEVREKEELWRELPPKIERARGRRPEMDTSGHFCPKEGCQHHGWLGRGNILSNGHPGSGSWRQMHCVLCGKYFQETLGTVFPPWRGCVPYGSTVRQEISCMRSRCCVGSKSAKSGTGVQVDKDTVLGWLLEAAAHSEVVLRYMMHHVHLEQVHISSL